MITLSVLLVVLLAIVSCGGGGGGTADTLPNLGGNGNGSGVTSVAPGTWTWMGGSTISGQTGTYGSQGVAAAGNIPGGRSEAASWIDGSGNFWLFGGYGFSSTGMTYSSLNDLWKFDGTNWTWIKGSMMTQQTGTYGLKGVSAVGNTPGARSRAVSWSAGNNLWLFGGYGYGSSGAAGWLNDLWMFDGTNWTWMNGATVTNQAGTYGTKGVAAAANLPGARSRAALATDGSGTVWLFSGSGYDSAGAYGSLNDLWKFDGTNWTWVNGSSTGGQSGSYGTKGIAGVANVPGGREAAALWIDGNGNIWLFGGMGIDSNGSGGDLNDLWKYDGTNWTWVSGSKTSDQLGIYGTMGVAAAGNAPGARYNATTWIDASNNLWLFGGLGYDSLPAAADMNELWRFDGTNWTWMAGSKIFGTYGIYGTKNTPAASNYPGARDAATRVVDNSHTVWMFGGMGNGSSATGLLNDLWRYQP